MQFKDLSLDIKAVEQQENDEGIVIAYASTFDRVPDSYGDIVAPGAFADTLKAWEERADNIPVLFGHRTDDPLMNIGVVTEAKEDEKGLLVTIKLDLDSERGAYTYKLIREGRVSKLSFAFSVLDEAPVELENGVKANELRKLDIYEVSIVPIPANHNTSVIEVRSQQQDKPSADEQVEPKHDEQVETLLKRIDDILTM